MLRKISYQKNQGQYYKTIYNIDYTALRYSNVYGPRQNTQGEAGVIALFISKMLQNQQCYINGDGNNTRDFVYVQDVVEANIQAILGDLSGSYNIATATQTNINQIFDILHQLTNTTITRQNREAKLGEQQHSCLSYDKIHQAINWQPKTNLPQIHLQTKLHLKTLYY